jgi:anti-sigma-K factor RskA
MISKPQNKRRRDAMVRFWRLIIYSAITAVLMVAIALAYLSATGPMSVTIVVATTLGVFLTVMVGAALMAAIFLSDSGGYDEDAGRRRRGSKPEK